MKELECPVNGLRPLREFTYGGEYHAPPDDADALSVSEWADYVFNRASAPGICLEWWYHNASGVWFMAERDTERDIFLKTFLYGERDDA